MTTTYPAPLEFDIEDPAVRQAFEEAARELGYEVQHGAGHAFTVLVPSPRGAYEFGWRSFARTIDTQPGTTR